jgi:hypothetical protein
MKKTQRAGLAAAAVLAAAALLGACAVPATRVEVPTLPMRAALDLARQTAAPAPLRTQAGPRLVATAQPQGSQRPLLSTPDVRLAYLYEWVDTEGNKHFGEWVAIAVAGFDWIMNDGAHEAMDGSSGAGAPALEAH